MREPTALVRFTVRITTAMGVYFRYTAHQEIQKVTPGGFGGKWIDARTRLRNVIRCRRMTFNSYWATSQR